MLVELICPTCRKVFFRHRHRIRTYRVSFCSHKCVRGINKGDKNANWKNNFVIITNKGYVKQKAPDHIRADRDGYVLQHILVMEKHLERSLTKEEVIHHINGNKLDNRIENLMLFDNHSEHLSYEHKERRL